MTNINTIQPSTGKTISKRFAFVFIFFFCHFFSCTELSFYEKNNSIPNHEWKSDFLSEGRFNISDTVARYNIYVVLRHTDKYKYNNIWLHVKMKMPSDSIDIQRLNLELGNDQQGWEGTGMDDIWEVRKKINSEPIKFSQKGNCSFEIRQIMRDDPLTYIMSAGLRIEKI